MRKNMATNSQCFSSRQEANGSDISSLVVVSFYKFADFPDHADLRKPLKDLCEELVESFLHQKESTEVSVGVIVTLGVPSVSPIERVGTYVSPEEWNELISDPETVVIDVRNTYETRIGKFKGALDPCTTAFRHFPSWVENQFALKQQGNETQAKTEKEDKAENPKTLPRIAMYCTGGIRCEKASSLLLSQGFEEVYHLKGGILKYLEQVPKTESLWEGECFVFNKRVSVEHGLAQGTYKLCYGCKQPISDDDMEAPEYDDTLHRVYYRKKKGMDQEKKIEEIQG